MRELRRVVALATMIESINIKIGEIDKKLEQIAKAFKSQVGDNQ